MKHGNGFTLAELLAVIVILGVITIIVFPAVNKTIKQSKEGTYEEQKNTIIRNAKRWSVENADQLSEDRSIYLSIDQLKREGYMENKDVVNPLTEEIMDGCIRISYDEEYNQYNYSYMDVSCDEIKTFAEVMEPLIGTEVNNNDPDGNLRYVGPTPNNYVWFNNERWRIIGVFDGQAKIIRDDYYSTSIKWDSNGSNNWATASLQLALNNTTDGYIKTIQTNDSTSYSYIDLEHVWNIGGYDYSYSTTGTRSAFYSAERSETISSVMTSHLWTGAIGLMYPSDYGYASSGASETCEGKDMYNWYTGDYKTECAQNSWLYDSKSHQWTLTPLSDYSYIVFFVNSTGNVYTNGVSSNFAARPVLFLKSDTKIVGGQGTYDDPYILIGG